MADKDYSNYKNFVKTEIEGTLFSANLKYKYNFKPTTIEQYNI